MNKIIDTKEEIPFENEYKYIDENKAHLHTYLGKPLLGTSTVINVLSKPLTYWASGLACEKFGWTNSKFTDKDTRLQIAFKKWKEIQDLDNEQYLALLDEAYKAHATKLKDSASTGTDMHALMEEYVNMCIDKGGQPIDFEAKEPKLKKFIEWSLENVNKFMYSEKHVYSSRLWLGGKFDLIFEDKNLKICLGDFKSSKEAYESQFIQIALYDIEQSENGIFNEGGYKMGEPLKISSYYVFPFGSDKFEVGVRHNTEELKNGGEACVILYKLTNK